MHFDDRLLMADDEGRVIRVETRWQGKDPDCRKVFPAGARNRRPIWQKRSALLFAQGLVGIAPPRLVHMLVHAEEVPEIARFMIDVLEFRLTEQLLNGAGHQTIAFLERSARPHDIAFVQGPNGALHHFAFWLDDWDHIRRAADILAYNGVTIDIGPTRHGMTRGNTIYFFDPMGTRNEVFTGGYRDNHR